MDPEPSVEPHFLKIVEAAEKSGIENVPLELETMRERLSHFKLNYEEIMGKQIYLDAILKNQVDESLYSEDDLSRLRIPFCPRMFIFLFY